MKRFAETIFTDQRNPVSDAFYLRLFTAPDQSAKNVKIMRLENLALYGNTPFLPLSLPFSSSPLPSISPPSHAHFLSSLPHSLTPCTLPLSFSLSHPLFLSLPDPATPGRLNDLLMNGNLTVHTVTYLVSEIEDVYLHSTCNTMQYNMQ